MDIDINVNKNSHIPIFFQIQKQIKEKIEKSDLSPGTQLPTERNLSSELGVSRVTIRKAIRGLISEGYCKKEVGKGIFVAENKFITNIHDLEGTSNFIKRRGFDIETEVVEEKIIKSNDMLNSKLELSSSQELLFLKRLRWVKDEPVMLEETYLPLEIFPEIKKYDFENSLYEIIKEEYDVYPDHSKGFFNILMATEKESDLLNIQLNTPLLVKEVTTYTKEDNPFEYNKTIFRTDKFKFIVDSKCNS